MKTYNRMLCRAIICSSLLILVGCASYEPLPDIVESPRIEPKVVSTKAVEQQPKTQPKPEPDTTFNDFPEDWLPPAQAEKNWKAIIVHHSATETGNEAIFDKMHREQNHWDGIGYDFVIGNGTNSNDGQVEVTFRWRRQIAGAHCGGTPDNWANVDAVGICLVGNFDYSTPSTEQMKSLLELISFLKLRYGISNSSIYGHRSTPGARVTDCPGSKFPMTRLKSMVGS